MKLFSLIALCIAPAFAGDARALLSEAQKQFEGGDYARSESLALKALEADPKLAGAELLLGIVASARSRIEDAVTHFSRAAQMDPHDYHAFGYLGAIYVRQKRFQDAETAFRKVLDLQPSNVAAHYNLGLIAMMLAKPAAALPHFSAVLDQDSSDAAALAGALESELSLNRREDARKYARQLERVMNPGDPRLFQAGALLAAHGENVAAVSIFAKVAAQNSDNEDYRFDLGKAVLQQATPESAVPVFAAAAEHFPASWRMRVGLGASYYLAGKYEEAAKALLDAHERKRDEPVIYFLLGKSYESAGALQDRIAAAFEKYISSDPRDAWAFYHFGMMLYQRGNNDAARQSFTKALSIDPNFADAHLQLGVMDQAVGRYEASVRSLERAIAANPNLGGAHYRLALAYQKLGQEQKAQSELEIFRKLKTGDQTTEDKTKVREVLGR